MGSLPKSIGNPRRFPFPSGVAVRGTRAPVALLAGLAAFLGTGATGPAAHAGPSGAPAAGLHIEDGRPVEADGDDFVMRGVHHAHTCHRGETQSFADIKETDADTVRVVLASGHRWSENSPEDVADVIDR
ncbi:mannan endo-1,4-beta-mannosidase [Streptomyces pini]|uniref:Mannan endo-1,4-beta-mannosidase n=1 Tax=Streptomyces pini TaxID=1520580 RepID=A0A1I3XR42_9ACTN|nr:mannan endo-1,4-beta-mannosidase [Streptomyces pini]